MSEPLISIIVPIYKVEPYLRKCLDSIINQTYRNLEIILVDDGSPDNCGAICDEYAARDNRIKVIHKENGGVSSARNVGLAASTGGWIGCVDPDDWIEPDMYDCMLKEALKCGADIAVCSRTEVYPDKEVPKGWEEDVVIDREDALSRLLLKDEAMQNYCCDKLSRTSLWEGIVFPEGRTFEDVAVMYKLFERTDKVACLSKRGYNYRQHSASIIADKSLKNELNYYHAAKERYEAMRERWPQFESQLLAQCAMCTIGIWWSYYANPKEVRREYLPQLREISAFCTPNAKRAGDILGIGLAGRLTLNLVPYVTWWSFGLAHLVGWLYEKKHGSPQ